ncbi:hypothetical protein LTR62_006739 [Meristemomyces frigidus]|uniref:Aminodeoxychorismate lyase n=1 Tax=Meristemomyces frigidus TaxID=1508187 RepID=A0AAN7YTD1_9PEZI|nr:hypothetical protein LTR62_006739 [Meristemomyces frigidus]
MNPNQEEALDDRHIFTTLRYDPTLLSSPPNTAASYGHPCAFYMLEHHFARLRAANGTTAPAGHPTALLRELSQAVEAWQAQHPGKHEHPPLRLKHRIHSQTHHTTTEIAPTATLTNDQMFPSSLHIPATHLPHTIPWRIRLDNLPTQPTHSTAYKTSDRSSYDRARTSAGITSLADKTEVLLFNPQGEIMDASISTPYFFREGKWVTPAAVCGGQQGTTRRWALETGLCVEAVVGKGSLCEGEVVWLSNAVRGYFSGRYVGL